MQRVVDQLLYRCAELETTLRMLLERVDEHWEGKTGTWHEQDLAHRVLKGIPRLDLDAAKHACGPVDVPFGE